MSAYSRAHGLVFTKLLGFQTVASTNNLDLQDGTVIDQLGVRIGLEERGMDFRDETLSAKLGAKVGELEPGA